MKEKSHNVFEKNKTITIIVVVIIFCIIIDFITAQIFIDNDIHSFRISHSYYHHGLLPCKTVTTTWDNKNFYSFYTNSLGFRDRHECYVPLKNKNKTILLIGDSHTEGVGLKYEDTYAGILDNRLNSDSIEVLNAAVVSYCPKLYYYKIKYLVEEVGLQFDELLVFIDISDIQNELVYKDFDPKKPTSFKKLSKRIKRFFRYNSMVYYSVNNIIESARRRKFYEQAQRAEENPKTDLYSTFFSDFYDSDLLQNQQFHNIGLWYLNRDIFEKWGREGLVLEKWYMTKLFELCRKNGTKLYVVIYPWPIQIVANDRNSLQVQFWKKFCNNHGIEFINLFPLFFQEYPDKNIIQNYFIKGDVHFNKAGHKLVADEIIKCLN